VLEDDEGVAGAGIALGAVWDSAAALKGAYAAGWLTDEAGWLDLLDMRNATSHTYREALARDVYRRIRTRAPMFHAALAELRSRVPEV
jgi:nucleotidyltransferase substrate binding protein (TIGR01987 family)